MIIVMKENTPALEIERMVKSLEDRIPDRQEHRVKKSRTGTCGRHIGPR